MDETFVRFADVMVPLPVPGLFTYRIPRELEEAVKPGCRVVVQFGKRKILAALVKVVHSRIPQLIAPKYIMGILDEQPVVNSVQFEFWEWIAGYYVCHPGEIMAAALPSALRLNSEARIMLHPEFVDDKDALSDNEYLITEALHAQPRLTVDEVSKIVGFKKVMPLLKTMIEKRQLIMEEELEQREIPKKEIIRAVEPGVSGRGKAQTTDGSVGKKGLQATGSPDGVYARNTFSGWRSLRSGTVHNYRSKRSKHSAGKGPG